jgi:hypothetical protein
MVTARTGGDSGGTTTRTPLTGKQVAVMYQLTQLASDMYRERLAYAEQQRPAQRLLALRRAERAERRMRRADRRVGRLSVQPGA